ncbi:hypothetical protein A2774_03035 [Candidatus Roizmanbacteria bacterium RIFCSPHIGHO2_01_FULL_39_12c]|uniref:Uncharacterized protein n=1 Tax=Candidatus Roizmanbacteria bacterium RIFCSPHIGHO2_01_FULL_39_12c TaxID=1802031 RepID=A0A1F7GC72_9BACT|nr:MAG: hypothetical protein A2774_03035 [Candidatus Roizmanbacteria bacterium RIFCSPHIGHO2_01_FULL_39_12c]OGK47426.1 MAG: hypothetical protein A2963_04705 [Candidatus Roizmanbacteria bacterium RIFCSPLOWO2_01_FULL_40_13]
MLFIDGTRRKLVQGMLLLISYYFALRILNSTNDFVTLVIIVSLYLAIFGTFKALFCSFASDLGKSKFNKSSFGKNLILSLLWVCSVILAKKAGASAWLFDSFDDATLLFFIYLPFALLFAISERTNIILAIILWLYTAFFYLNNFKLTTDLFTILAFWLFALAVFKKFYEV